MRRFHLLIRTNWISSLGAALFTCAGLAAAASIYLQFSGQSTGPYDAILTLLALPAVMAVGLLLIPVGLFLHRRRLKERLEELADKPLNTARAVAAITILTLAGMLIAGQQGIGYMSSNGFCGTTCHVQMDPEWTTFQDSAHANIHCVDCHVGRGVEASVKAKLNGTHQLLGVLTGNWERPIPTPVHQLRPAEEICNECHWPEKYLGVKLAVHTRYREDEPNTSYVNVLLMRTGGTHPDGKATGIHWHTNPNVSVDYVAIDEHRDVIPWVKTVREDGSEKIFVANGAASRDAPEGELRRMDCNDCHNRSGHDFDEPGDAVDRAIAAGLISRQLPFIKKWGVEVLRMERVRPSAEQNIHDTLTKRYEDAGLLDDRSRPLVEGAAKQLAKIWLRNIFPERAQLWDVYPDLKSHRGCFRCHDGNHVDGEGQVLTNRCDACHVVLSEEQEDPAILGTLGVGGGR